MGVLRRIIQVKMMLESLKTIINLQQVLRRAKALLAFAVVVSHKLIWAVHVFAFLVGYYQQDVS